MKNKERLITMTNALQTIANNYLCIDDTGFMERNKPDDDFSENTETEEQLMNDIWSNYIDHLYERDRMLFSHLFVKKDHTVMAHFIDVYPKGIDINTNNYIESIDVPLSINDTPETLKHKKEHLLYQ